MHRAGARRATHGLRALSDELGVRAGAADRLGHSGRSHRRLAQAMHAIWRYLLDIDWMARVKASLLPLEHPLLLLMKEPRRLGFSLRDGVWVRLLDVKTALSARSYQDRGSVVIEVIDAFCPWNAGCWQIAADGVERTDEAPALRCDVSALGSVYLGGFTWTRLARALRAQELVPGGIAHADAIFHAGSAPWCPEFFERAISENF